MATLRKSIKTGAALVAVVLATLCATLMVQSQRIDTLLLHRNQKTGRRQLRRQAPGGTPAAVASDPPPQDVGNSTAAPFDPNTYAYLIVHYHKTGHHLSRSLRDFLVAGTDGAPVSNDRENTFHFRDHDEGTGCPRAMELAPGVIHVQAAPDFFCDINVLAEYLLRNNDVLREKRGVKVIHLVRNPFDLAVSNWIYHAQYPTPELWVKTIDPCAAELWFERQSLGDLVAPALSMGEAPVVRNEDFAALNNLCMELYRNTKTTKNWSFYTHLRHLEPEAALSLATTHMMAQGKSGGDVIRMANNMVKLRQVQQLEDHIRASQHLLPPSPEERMVQVMTLSMHEFVHEPKAATLRFLDFALGDASPPEVKMKIATEYEQSYLEKVKKGDEHITSDKEILNGDKENIVEKKEQLEKYLREHELFGRVLGNVERLVQDALRDSGSVL